MLVKVVSFGSNWWARFGHDPEDPYRFTRHAAYFNSTGLRSGNKVRRHWIVPGLLRFNGVGDFNPQSPDRSIGSSFECPELTVAFGGHRLLFGRRIKNPAQPDCYLLAINSETCGVFDCQLADWVSEGVRPVAISQHRNRSEALLLMRQGDWVRTKLGIWRLTATASHPIAMLTVDEPSEQNA